MYNSFTKEPKIKVNPRDKEKPFVLLNDTFYLSSVFNKTESLGISFHKGYNWNGANIPRFLWRVVGSQYNPEFLPASMVHDWLCENKNFLKCDGVRISSDIFRDILILYGVNSFKAKIMAAAVRAWQSLQKGWK